MARPQDRRDELGGLTVEHQQGMVHVLAVVAVVGTPFLLSVRGIVRAVQVQHDMRRHPVPFPLAQVEFPQGHGQALAALAIDRVLQPVSYTHLTLPTTPYV